MKDNQIKGYIVLTQGWEYNDEYYFRPDSESGTPKAVYVTQEAAEAAALALNVQQFKEFVIDSYTYKWSGKNKTLPTGQFFDEAAIEESLEYMGEDHDLVFHAMSKLQNNSPGLWINPKTEMHRDYQIKLSRPLTPEEIGLYMKESGIGNSYVQEVEIVYE
jgi:hypothetical protein